MVLGKLSIHVQKKMKLDPCLTPYTKTRNGSKIKIYELANPEKEQNGGYEGLQREGQRESLLM